VTRFILIPLLFLTPTSFCLATYLPLNLPDFRDATTIQLPKSTYHTTNETISLLAEKVTDVGLQFSPPPRNCYIFGLTLDRGLWDYMSEDS
jgi:hypothetical protein